MDKGICPHITKLQIENLIVSKLVMSKQLRAAGLPLSKQGAAITPREQTRCMSLVKLTCSPEKSGVLS